MRTSSMPERRRCNGINPMELILVTSLENR